MDLDMWKHPSTQRNVETLRKDGVIIIEPEAGELASGLTGKGRMEEPEAIARRIELFFEKSQSLRGKRVVVTAGPTYENIDPVRFIGNYSSGKMGFAIAEEFSARGAEVTVVAGPVSIKLQNPAIRRIDVVSAKEMYGACMSLAGDSDCMVLAAAVADYAPAVVSDKKIKRELAEDMCIRLVRNPDIAASLGKEKNGTLLVGFALETDKEEENAIAKLKRKNLDWIVLNSMRDPEAGFMKDTNKVTVISAAGDKKAFPAKSKRDVARDIVDIVSVDLTK